MSTNPEYTNSIFEESWWLDTVMPGQWKEICIEEENKIVARWAFCQHGNRIVMPPLTQTCSPWIMLNSQQRQKNCENLQQRINELLEKVSFCKSISIALDSSTSYFLPFYWKGFHIRPYITYRIRHLNNLDAVFNSFSKNVKRDIKAAEKKLHITYECSADILYSVMEKTFAEQKRRYPIEKELLGNVVKNSQKHHAGRMISARDKDGNLHASALFLYDKRRCYYLIGGKDASYKNSNGLTLVIWEGIKFAASVSEEFDFEGSVIEGIENYFRRFGGEPVVYYEVKRQGFFLDFADLLKPYVKELIGYKS